MLRPRGGGEGARGTKCGARGAGEEPGGLRAAPKGGGEPWGLSAKCLCIDSFSFS